MGSERIADKCPQARSLLKFEGLQRKQDRKQARLRVVPWETFLPSFLVGAPRTFLSHCWYCSGFWKKLGFYFVLILIVNGLITVGYYTMDHCYGVVQNKNGKWQLISNCHAHHHQFELILNFPGGISPFLRFPIALDFVLDPAPLPPPASSTYIAITPVLNAPSENSSSQTANPYNPKADIAVVESATEKKPVEISRSKSGTIPAVPTIFT